MSPASGDAPKIFIVDDSESLRYLMTQVLGQEFSGALVEGFASAHVALEAIGARTPALVITDYRMPGMDGMELVRRARVRSPGTRFVLTSGFSRLPQDPPDVAGLELDGLLPKPVSPRDLIEMVQSLLPRAS